MFKILGYTWENNAADLADMGPLTCSVTFFILVVVLVADRCSIGCLAVIAGETQAGVPKVQGGKRGDPIPGCMLQFVNCGGPSRPFSAWRVAKTVSVYLDKSFGRFDLLPVTVPDLWPVTVPGGGGRLTGVTGVPRGT